MGGGSTNSTSTYSPPAAVSEAYTSLLNNAQNLVYPNGKDQPMNPYPQYTPAEQAQSQALIPSLVAPFSQNQTQAGNTIASLAGYAQPYVNAGTGLALAGSSPIQLQQFSPNAVNQYMSPYMQNVMGSTVANINETNAQQQQQLLGNLIQKGAYGGDRAAIAQSELARQQGLANNATLANIANAGYSQSLGEFNTQQALDAQRQLQSNQLALSAAPLMANLGGYGQSAALQQAQAQYGYGTGEQQQQQAGLSTAYQNYLNRQSYPYQQLGFLGGLTSGAATGMGGTTTSSIPQPGTANQVIGGLGALASLGNIGGLFSSGAGAAGAAGGGAGFLSSLGSGIGAAASGIGEGIGTFATALASIFSDERIKEGLRPVGKTFDGQNIYTYRYKGDPTKATHMGLLAQEVEHRHPEAVHENGGLKMVNYDVATNHAAHRGHFALGGSTETDLLKASPVAGMAATNPFPTVSMNASPHMPSAPNTKPESLDTAKLKDAVQGIKSLMGKPTQSGVAGAANSAPQPPVIQPSQMSDDMKNMPLPPTIPTESRGGLIGHYDAGGIVLPQGMMTKDDLKNFSELSAGSGVAGVPSSLYAVASEDLLPSQAYRGGVIMKDDGGPVEGVAAVPANTYGIPANLYPHYVEASKETGVPIQLLAAKDKQESRFNNEATGGAGEVGISQVLPSTARSPGFGMQGVEPESLRDPRENILFGARYLAARGNSAGVKNWEDPNESAKALRAYNGGGDPNYVQNVFQHMPGGAAINAAMKGSGTPAQTQTPAPTQEQRIPVQSQATKEGLFGALGIAMTPEQRLASFQAFAKLAGTPGKFGVGLAAAADTYAKTLLEAQGQTRQNSLAQSQSEEQRSRAGLAKAEEMDKRIKPGLTGAYVTTPGPDGEPTLKFIEMPKATTTAAGTTGAIGTPGGSQTPFQTDGTPQAPQAPTGPGSKAAAESMSYGPVHDNPTSPDALRKDEIMREEAQKIVNRGEVQLNPQIQENYRKQYNDQLTAAREESKAASNGVTNLADWVHSMAETPDSGFLAPGAAASIRMGSANYFNTLGKVFGKDFNLDNTLSAAQVNDKLATINAQLAQTGLGKEAGFWLQSLAKASPNQELTKETSADILSNMIVQNGKSRDRYNVYNKYGSEYAAGVGYNAQNVFDRVNPQGDYNKDKDIIKNILLTTITDKETGRPTNFINELIKHPERAKEWNAAMKKRFGSSNNLSNYFVGAMQ